jgi:hypothetical protein
MTEPTMAQKTQLPPRVTLTEAAGNLRVAQEAVKVAASARGQAEKALRQADTELVLAKHALAQAERHVVLTALMETDPPKPVPKTREEMAAFATEWDAKVEAGRAKQAAS